MLAKLFTIPIALAAMALAQPGQPAPAQPSAMRDSRPSPRRCRAGLEGVGVEQKLDAQVPLQLCLSRRIQPQPCRSPLTSTASR